MNKEYFMNRLANGEDMNVIGAEIAAAMNAAMAEHNARIEAEKAAEADKANAKRELMEEMVDIIREYAILEGMDEGDFNVTEEEIESLVNAFSEMFTALREVKKMINAIDVKKVSTIAPNKSKSDDQILAEFAKMFS